jgi:hypothetical protein
LAIPPPSVVPVFIGRDSFMAWQFRTVRMS